jgi:hypothetical protein
VPKFTKKKIFEIEREQITDLHFAEESLGHPSMVFGYE